MRAQDRIAARARHQYAREGIIDHGARRDEEPSFSQVRLQERAKVPKRDLVQRSVHRGPRSVAGQVEVPVTGGGEPLEHLTQLALGPYVVVLAMLAAECEDLRDDSAFEPLILLIIEVQ